MDRFKINCIISGNHVELQFDIKKIPEEKGPCYMVSIDGLFKGYVKKEKSGNYGPVINSNLSDDYMDIINEQLIHLTK